MLAVFSCLSRAVLTYLSRKAGDGPVPEGLHTQVPLPRCCMVVPLGMQRIAIAGQQVNRSDRPRVIGSNW